MNEMCTSSIGDWEAGQMNENTTDLIVSDRFVSALVGRRVNER